MVTIGDATPDGGLEPVQSPTLGFGAKLWSLFVDPRKTFQGVRRNHEWVILWLLVGAISIGGYLPIKDIYKHDQLERAEERLSQMTQLTPEQQEQALSDAEARFENPAFLLIGPVFILLAMVIVAAVLMFLGNIVLGGNTSFLLMLNAFGWIMLIALPEVILKVPLVIAKGSSDVSLGLGVLTGPETTGFLKTFLSSFEVFAIWQVTLSSIALSVLADVDTKKAFWAVFITWMIWVVVKSGLAAIGLDFG